MGQSATREILKKVERNTEVAQNYHPIPKERKASNEQRGIHTESIRRRQRKEREKIEEGKRHSITN